MEKFSFVQRWIFLCLTCFYLIGCTTVDETETPTAVVNQPTAAPAATQTSPPSPTPLPPTPTPLSPTAVPTSPPTAVPPTSVPLADLPAADDFIVSGTASDLALVPDTLFIYPVPTLYEGDVATFQFVAHVPAGINSEEVEVRILVNENIITTGTLNGHNLGGDTIGRFEWAWDTVGQRGNHTVTIALDPDDHITAGDENPTNNVVTRTVSVQSSRNLPYKEIDAEWITRETDYAHVHVVSGTAAHRDLERLLAETDTAFAKVVERLGERPARKFDVYFIDRVIGQGGYASGSMVISYLDRNYSGGGLQEVLQHEAAHLLDFQFAPRRVTMLAEGVAVWASGGHYKQENLDARAAALIETELYVPLAELADNFYPIQHEIGYLEAGAFVNYLVDQYGWTKVRAFYEDVTLYGYSSVSASLDANLQGHFGRTLDQVETEWHTYLEALPPDPAAVPDVLATVRYYDVMRSYQKAYDPTAHFLTAWLPTPQDAQTRGLTASLTRHPEEEINLILETLLVSADQALRAGDYQNADVLLSSVERAIDNNGALMDPLAISYRDIIRKAAAAGYEVQQVMLEGNQASALATGSFSATLVSLTFSRTQSQWILLR